MIKNERQYRITRAQAEKFARALAHMDEHLEETASVGPRLRAAMKDGLASQLADLREEMEEYEAMTAALPDSREGGVGDAQRRQVCVTGTYDPAGVVALASFV